MLCTIVWELTESNSLVLQICGTHNIVWTHCTMGNDFETSWTAQGSLKYQPVMSVAHLPIYCKPCPNHENTSSRINIPLAMNSWDHLQYLLFASQSRVKSCSTALLLNGHRFKSFVTEWAKEYNTQLQTANRHKQFLGLVGNQVPYHPVSLQLNHNVCTFFVSSTKLVIQNFYIILYTDLLHGTADIGPFFQNSGIIFSITHTSEFTIYT
jgi:hypothetical protein